VLLGTELPPDTGADTIFVDDSTTSPAGSWDGQSLLAGLNPFTQFNVGGTLFTGPVAHNNMPPYLAWNWIIKT
jgi:hypothetical protein